MILFVDLEHESSYEDRSTEWVLAARTRISYRLEDITGDRCLLQRYRLVGPDLIEELDIRAVFLSGQGAEREHYDGADLAGLNAIVTDGSVPVFGFCGGLQFMAEALGVTIERIGRLADDEEDPVPEYQAGWRKEVGYQPVEVLVDHPLVEGLGPAPVFRHAHTWQLASIPDGFCNVARTAITEVQLVADDRRRLAGSQFHPEFWTDEHPEGRRLIENFCRWTGLLESA